MSIDTLKEYLAPVSDLSAAAALLEWDQETYMPPGAAEARAHQLATLKRLAHEHLTSDEVGLLLEDLERNKPADDLDRALVRVARRDFDRATKLSADFVTRFATAKARALEAWKHARQDDDFGRFAPHLREIVDLSVEQAEALGYDPPDQGGCRYDALLDAYEPGATTAEIEALFGDLREHLVPIVQALAEAEPPDDSVLHRSFDAERQWHFGLEVARALGYDFVCGRQDHSAHPFTTSFSTRDVRVTTRIAPDFFPTGLFGTIHEVGHALYEQGIEPALERTPLADGTSLGVHESQSRLWENLVGRSRGFWRWAYPRLRQTFPDVLAGVAEDAFYRAVNRVRPSLIRVEADEVTYNLHVMLRFQIETALVSGSLAPRDVPEAWNAAMQDLLGLAPPSDADGCLQDIHWALGAMGYFPTYTLGTLMSVQLFEAAERDLGDLGEMFERGEFEPVLGWMREHVHRWGRARSAAEIMDEATGGPLSAEPWLAYVRRKFGAVYGVSL
ncbi:MAG: carboxypeptidase M32 [Bacteroidota bacterium]